MGVNCPLYCVHFPHYAYTINYTERPVVLQVLFCYTFGMYQKKSRKKELARRTAIYALMTSSVIGLMIILMLTILGYQYNFNTRRVEQTGLVQFHSYPRGARVTIDGQDYVTTPTKNTVQEGQHQFAMTLKGYEPWQKTLTIQPGGVTWLNYARLVPTEKVITSALTLPGQQTVKASPDRRFMAGIHLAEGNGPQLSLIDFRDSEQPVLQTHPLPSELLSGMAPEATHQFTITEWSYASRYLLVKHTYTAADATQHEWLLIDREAPAEMINVTAKVNLAFQDVQFAGERELYGLQANGDVRRISVDSNTVSGPVLSHVTQFQVYVYDIIAYTAQQDQRLTAGVWRKNWEKPTILESVATSENTPLHIRASSYFNKDTVIISRGNTLKIYRGALPATAAEHSVFVQSPKTFTLNRPINTIQTSGNGRFIAAEDVSGVVTYDLERDAVSQELKKYHPAAIAWLDDYHFWQITEAGQLEMREFDGVNSHLLMPASGYDVVLTRDERYIYALLTRDDGTLTLQRLSMTAAS